MVGMGAQRGQVVLVQFRVQPGRLGDVGHMFQGGALVARHGRNPHQCSNIAGKGFGVDGGVHGGETLIPGPSASTPRFLEADDRSMHAPLVEVYALERRFGARAVLSAVDLVVGAGEIPGLLGPPGAGKTTLLRVLARVPPTSRGWLRVAERAVLVAPTETDPRIALARAVATSPDLLLLDAGGFDSDTLRLARALLDRHTARGG